jgi:probable rRNA maturation factor
VVELDLQNALDPESPEAAAIPEAQQFEAWVAASTGAGHSDSQVTIRLVDVVEMSDLNQTYRHKKGPTNVLSFPFEAPPEVDLPLLGDIIICAAVVNREAVEQNKPLDAHWAHIVVHGCLHLQGYDHIEEKEAEQMERLETEILTGLGFGDPYEYGD